MRDTIIEAESEVDNLLMSSLRSQDMFIKKLISLHGTEKIEQLNLRSEDERIEIEV